ncbi:MAG: diacylglycerol kinase family lipid kinase [Opitutaceae bacterium]|nr:diacylglycerol kinase family lipid kinase [Opitutaceae bacterium]
MKTRFIVNLRSGHAARALAEVRTHAAAHGAGVVLTERARHASELAQQAIADGCELIVAVGGDGTMNETASALIDTPATLGLIPCGSGDGLGRHLRIHGSVTRALGILRDGQPQHIDTGRADGHPFFTVAGLGFEAEISSRFNRLAHRGFWRYVTTIAQTLRTWEPQDFVITHSGGTETLRAFTLAVANCAQYGNGVRVAPGAQIDDGLLDLCVLAPVTLWNAVPLVGRLFAGTLAGSSNATLRRGDRFVVERAAPGLLHTDGETHEGGTRLEFVVRPASLRVMCPADSDT